MEIEALIGDDLSLDILETISPVAVPLPGDLQRATRRPWIPNVDRTGLPPQRRPGEIRDAARRLPRVAVR